MTNLLDDIQTGRRRFLGGLTVGGVGLAAGGSLSASLTLAAQTPPSTPPAAPVAALPPAALASLPARSQALRAAPLREVQGKTAYVTGASSGIGLGIARAAYEQGMNVVLGYIDDSQIEGALAVFEDRSRVMALKHDVTDRASWARAADDMEKRFGRVHLLVNNAGVGVRAQVAEATHNDYDWGFNVNVAGVFNGIHAFVPRMRQYGEGAHIVTTSSMSGILPGAKAGIYTATKFAALGLMEALRVELEETDIGTSCYLPGGVNTNIGRSELYRPEALRNARAPAPNAPATRPPAAAGAPTGPNMDPLEAGRLVMAGVRNNDLFIFSHPEFKAGIAERFEAILASVPAMVAPIPQSRLASERVTMRVPLYSAETARLLARQGG